MCRPICIFLVLCLALVARGQMDSRQARIQAATDNAAQDILAQIHAQRLEAGMTVDDFLNETGGDPALRDFLRRSRPIGGPRWLEDSACQIRLEVNGADIAHLLVDIASRNPAQSPIPPDQLSLLLANLRTHVFTATGSSASFGINPPPPSDSAWAPIPSNLRLVAIQQATTNAVSTVLASISTIEVANNQTVGDTLQISDVKDALTQWLLARPVTSIDYRRSSSDGSLQVRVTLAVNASDLFDTYRAILMVRDIVPHFSDAQSWADLRAKIANSMAAAVGTAVLAQSATAPVATQPVVTIPSQPPNWASTTLDVTGAGAPMRNPLRAARAAEANAMAALNSAVQALPLDSQQSIADACRGNPWLQRRISRAIEEGAHLASAHYHADGSVTCQMTLDLNLVWSALEDQP